jgi:hypothetical protein
MRKILFIRNYRSGTNLINFLLGKKMTSFSANSTIRKVYQGKPIINPAVVHKNAFSGSWVGTEHSFFLPTNPPEICPCENLLITGHNIQSVLDHNLNSPYFAWYTQHGDWWGESTSATVPEPYEVETGVRYGPNDLLSLPGNDWKFIYFLRDARNQIESLRNLPGGIEGEKQKDNPTDYFELLCKAFRNRARMTIDSNNQLSNFIIIRFEDLVRSPIKTLSEAFSFSGLCLDQNFIKKSLALSKTKKTVEQHSSFKSKKNINKRWSNWSKWEVDTFKSIAGNELIELGYEKDLNW